MNGIGHANNSCLYLGDFNPYFRIGKYLYDPSGKNSSYYYNSLTKDEMKKYLNKNFSKEEILDMLLDFVSDGDEYQCATA